VVVAVADIRMEMLEEEEAGAMGTMLSLLLVVCQAPTALQ